MAKTRKINVFRAHRDNRGRRTTNEYICSTNRYALCRDAADSVRNAYFPGQTVELFGRIDEGY